MAAVMTWQRRLTRCVGVGIVLLAWQITTQLNFVSTFLLPPLTDIFSRMGQELLGSELPMAIISTILRSLAGFFLAVAAGIPLGLMIAKVGVVRWLLDPIVSLGLPSPKIAFLPIFILWFGVFDESKVLMAAFSSIFPIIAATWAGSAAVDRFYLWSAANMGAKPGAIVWEVVLPAALPSILTGVQIALPYALIVTIIAEMSTGGEGLGGYMIFAMRLADSVAVFVGLFCTAFVGFLMLKIMEYVRYRLLIWHEESQR